MGDNYEVLGGDDLAEFRQHDDGSIELFSEEVSEETGEQYGHIGNISTDELTELADALKAVFVQGEDEAEKPELDDLTVGQHPLVPEELIFTATDEDGGMDESKGALIEPSVVINAAESLAAEA